MTSGYGDTNYTKDELLEDLARVAAIHQARTISQSEYAEYGVASPNTIKRHFGSWSNAHRAAGLVPRFQASNPGAGAKYAHLNWEDVAPDGPTKEGDTA